LFKTYLLKTGNCPPVLPSRSLLHL